MGTEETTKQVHPTIPSSKNSDKAEILVRNFVSQYRRPFSTDTIASYTGISTKRLKPIIDRLISDQQIKVVSIDPEQIYVKANRYMGIYEKTHDHNRWNFDQDKAMILLKEVETTRHRNVRTIAKAIGKSRQWVYVYLEALASIGAIEKEDGYYKIITKDCVWAIGTNIKKGILKFSITE
ncbi:MAG: hypothetical protein PHS20_09365 [Sphaerochaetaceae bacterium]|nr:hypothetical protein [Sphaerochaetaceae bacterium]